MNIKSATHGFACCHGWYSSTIVFCFIVFQRMVQGRLSTTRQKVVRYCYYSPMRLSLIVASRIPAVAPYVDRSVTTQSFCSFQDTYDLSELAFLVATT